MIDGRLFTQHELSWLDDVLPESSKAKKKRVIVLIIRTMNVKLCFFFIKLLKTKLKMSSLTNYMVILTKLSVNNNYFDFI